MKINDFENLRRPFLTLTSEVRCPAMVKSGVPEIKQNFTKTVSLVLIGKSRLTRKL